MHLHRSAPASLAAAFLLVGLATVTAGRAQSMDGAFAPPSAATKTAVAAPLHLGQVLSASPIHTLRSAEQGARDQLDALRAWNAAGRRPFKVGFSRPLPEILDVRLEPSMAGHSAPVAAAGGYLADAEPGWLVWGTHVKVTGAHRVRLHLSNVHLPAGTRMYVAEPGGTPHAFGLELVAPAGDLWTPSVPGESEIFEVDVPVAALGANPRPGFELREVLEMIDFGAGQPGGLAGVFGQPPASPSFGAAPMSSSLGKQAAGTSPFSSVVKVDTSCLVDATCETNADLPNINNYRRAMAQLIFAVGSDLFLCSGSLLNDTASDFIPYLLTANHCFSDQSSASSLEAFFDFKTASCNGAAPNESSEPQSNGSTLLATQDENSGSDFTLVRLFSVPSNRLFLGWNANASALHAGVSLYRISYPAPSGLPLPQSYTQYTYDPTFNPGTMCHSQPNFFYEQNVRGATFGGSSGSPVLLANGQVVGQLNGACGPDPNNPCDFANEDDDGAFSVSFPSLQPFLAPSGSTQPCVANATTLCIDDHSGDHRFAITLSYHTTQGGGSSGNGNAIPLSSLGVSEGGLFWIFAANNPEMLIKVIDACAIGPNFWVFFAAVTNVGFTVTVTDTTTGHQRSYSNADIHAALPVQDTSALVCP